MAGNNSIQILRGTASNVVNSGETLLAGQPLYISDKKFLVIGSSDGDAANSAPITCQQLLGYVGDSTTTVGSCTTATAWVNVSGGEMADIRGSRYARVNAPDTIIGYGDNHFSVNSTEVEIKAYLKPLNILTSGPGGDIEINSYGNTSILSSGTGTNININARGSVRLWGDQGVNISTISGVNITPKSLVHIASDKIEIINNYGPALTLSNAAACFNSNVSVVDSLGQGVTVNSARILRVFSGNTYSYELPLYSGTIALTVPNSGFTWSRINVKSYSPSTTIYVYDDITHICGNNASTNRYYHVVRLVASNWNASATDLTFTVISNTGISPSAISGLNAFSGCNGVASGYFSGKVVTHVNFSGNNMSYLNVYY